MTANLPQGVVTNNPKLTSDIERIDTISVEDIARLWRGISANSMHCFSVLKSQLTDVAYTTSRNVLDDDIPLRLENLFWRIWSNERIRRTVKGSTVAWLFIKISEDQSRIRTTPTQSPRRDRGLMDVRPVSGPPSPKHRCLAFPHSHRIFPLLILVDEKRKQRFAMAPIRSLNVHLALQPRKPFSPHPS
jgi:hypothetical protein